MSIAAKHAKGKSAQDKIFGANAAAVAAAAKYGKDAVTNATIGAILDEDEKLVCLPTVEEVFRGLSTNDLFINARNLIKTKIAEKLGRAAFGIEKQMCICTFKLYFHEVGHNLVHETFSLMDTAHCHAAQGIAEAASGCNDI